MKCPNCKLSNNKILLQDQKWLNNHKFICGNCFVEFQIDFLHSKLPLNAQLWLNYNAQVKFKLLEAIESIEEKVNNMTYDEKIKRLDELNKKK